MEQQQKPIGPRQPRIHRNAAEIRQLLQSQRQSKLTVKSWYEANGIRENSFYRWTKTYGNKPIKRRQENKPVPLNGFARLEITPGTVKSSIPSLFAEIGQLRLYKEVPALYLKTLLS